MIPKFRRQLHCYTCQASFGKGWLPVCWMRINQQAAAASVCKHHSTTVQLGIKDQLHPDADTILCHNATYIHQSTGYMSQQLQCVQTPQAMPQYADLASEGTTVVPTTELQVLVMRYISNALQPLVQKESELCHAAGVR